MRTIAFVFLVFICELSFAQDIHWSQFFNNSLYLSPANSGNFKGNARIISSYREQWKSVTKPFKTFSFSYDTHLKKNQDVGLGFLLFNDNSGDGKFKTIELQLMPSYRKFLNKDSTQQLTAGLQIAFNHRQFTFPNFYFDEQYNGLNYDPNAPITEELITSKRNNLSLGTGISYEVIKDKKHSFQFGFSAFNLNQPNQGFYGEKVKRDVRLSLFANATVKLNEKINVLPSILFQKQGTFRELIFGSQVKYTLKNDAKSYKAISGGIFMRKKDAFFLNFGIGLNNFYVALSYDVNISNLKPASNSRGGFELNLKYIFNKYNPKQIQHRVCPEFI